MCPIARKNGTRMGARSPSIGRMDGWLNIFCDSFPILPSVCLALFRTNVIVPSYAILIFILACCSLFSMFDFVSDPVLKY